MTNKAKGYLGNQNLKEAGVDIQFTEEQVVEYMKCAKDPVYFIEKYIKVVSLDEGLVPFKLYDFQEDMVQTVHENRFVIAKLPRQSGKSTTMVAYMLHYILFNQNMNVAILANKQSVAKDILSRLQLTYEYLPLWLQQGIVEWNKGSIKLENGSKIIASSTSSSAIRGGSYNAILLDEFAHVPTNIAEEFFNSVYPTISAGQETKVIMISTPNGLNMFYYYWKGATKKPGEGGKNEYIPIEVQWDEVPQYPGGPLRDEKWKEDTIANTSADQFQQEFICDFLGSQNTLISSAKLRIMNWATPKTKDADGLWIYEEPQEDRDYFITVDTSRGQGKDYSAFVVVDATDMPYKMVARYRNNTVSPMVYPTIIRAVAMKYNSASVLIEINDIGGQVADILHQDLEYENVMMTTYQGRAGQVMSGGFGGRSSQSQLGVRTTMPVKKLGCSVLKSLIEEDKLLIEDVDTINELITFIAKKNSFEADDGHTDDLVMSLVLFAWMTRQDYFKSMTDADVRTQIYEEKIRDIENELMPFGFIVDEVDESEWDGEDRWFSV